VKCEVTVQWDLRVRIIKELKKIKEKWLTISRIMNRLD
jgi:hypothetical protein